MSRAMETREPAVILAELDQLRVTLAVSLTQAAEQVRTQGIPPPPEVLQQLQHYRQRLSSVHQTWAGGSPASGASSRLSLSLMRGLSERYGDANRWRQQLAAILNLVHVDDSNYVPLLNCQQAALELRSQLLRSPDQLSPQVWESCANDTHPLQALKHLAYDATALSDDEWAAAGERVAAAFGKELLTALARGKIVPQRATPILARIPRTTPLSPAKTITAPASIPIPPQPPAIVTETPTTRHSAADVETSGTVRYQPDWGPRETELIPGQLGMTLPPSLQSAWLAQQGASTPSSNPAISTTPAVESSNATTSIFDDSPAPVASSANWSSRPTIALTSPAKSTAVGGSSLRGGSSNLAINNRDQAQQLARQLLQTDSHARQPLLAELIVQLLHTDRLGLAYHLLRVREEQRLSLADAPASWIVRAMTLGRTVRFPHGETTRLLEEDFAKFKPSLIQSQTDEHSIAIGLCLRAAAMTPALFTASPAAIGILRSFRISPDFTQLYNFCSRMALFGQRLQGQLAASGNAANSDLSSVSELPHLQARVAHWLRETITEFNRVQRSSPLYLHAHWTVLAGSGRRQPELVAQWVRWQGVFRSVGKLLGPVLNTDGADRHEMRHEFERVSRQLQEETTGLGVDAYPAAEEARLTPEMRRVLEQAVDYASQWLRISGQSTAGGTASIVSREISELRQEIQQRIGPVMVELRAVAHVSQSRFVRAAVQCCQRAIEDLQELFAPEEWTTCREVDPRHQLHAELLKLPAPQMNEQWIPQAPAATLEQELLELLSHDDIDWTEAFHWQCSLLDHVTTGRLLELDVWESTEQCAELRGVRAAAILQCRNDLRQELTEIHRELQAAEELQLLSVVDVAGLKQRVERLESAIPQATDFAELQRQLGQIRKSLQRRQHQEVQRMERRLAQLKPRNPSSSVLLTAQTKPPTDRPAERNEEPGSSTGTSSSNSNWVLDV